MNAPERWEAFVLPDGMKKATFEPDTLTPNTILITLNREDHTLGNLICGALQRDSLVEFAGYKVPHPLQHHVLIRVQTKRGYDPLDVTQQAIERLIKELSSVEDQVREQVKRFPLHGPVNKSY